jgi:hypothetical protein
MTKLATVSDYVDSLPEHQQELFTTWLQQARKLEVQGGQPL